MIRMAVESDLSPEEVVQRARAFFGPDGWGLEITEFADCCARFVGGGGHVYVQALSPDEEAGEDAAGSRIEIVGREWEHQIREFLGRI